jgi:hypothetical protein
MTTAPMTAGRVQGPITAGRVQGLNTGRSSLAWGPHDHFHNRFHNHFRHNRLFAFGFGGPFYDYAYDSCWAQVPTYYGWQWVYVCGDYGY